MRAAFVASTRTVSRFVQWTASTKARTCSSSTPTNASIAAFASLNALLTLSSPTRSQGPKSGSTTTTNTLPFGPTSRGQNLRPDADAFVNVPDKFAKYFSRNPGEGDQAKFRNALRPHASLRA